MKAIDLFAGGGGLSLGLQQAGIEVVAAFDNWDPAIEFYRSNIKSHPIHKVDLSSVEAVSKISQYDCDIIVGGPPCQDFSSAGKRDETLGRANLTISFANIIEHVRPKYFIMENVERARKSQTFKEAIAIFRQAGYTLSVMVLDASLCGVPQKRKRLIVFGEQGGRDNALIPYIEEAQSEKPMTVRDYFGDSLGVSHYYRHPRSYQRRGIFSIDEPSPTIRGVNRPVPPGYPGHPGDTAPLSDRIRPLTFEERSQIQTFPPGIKLDGAKTDIEQIIGNAVPVKLAEFVARCVKKYVANRSSKAPVYLESAKGQLVFFEQKATYTA